MTDTEQSVKLVLLIEDDTELCVLMADYFGPLGFRIEAVHDGPTGLARSIESNFDLIILDVMLPVVNGFELLRQFRKRSTTPVIMLTARTAREDRIDGLNAGADDYLPKPFEPEELLARIRAVLRRTGNVAQAQQTFVESAGIRLNPMTREVWRMNELVEVTSIEFEILDILVRSAGRVVSRDELSAVLHQRRSTPYERSLDVHISHLRKKLEHEGGPLIRTIRGVGYRFSSGTDQTS